MRVSPDLVVGNICLKYLNAREARGVDISLQLDELQEYITELKQIFDNDEGQKQHLRYIEVYEKDILDTFACYPDYVSIERQQDGGIIRFVVKKNYVSSLKTNLDCFVRKTSPNWLTEKIEAIEVAVDA